jgi:uncharacterized membrane protein YcaP (DUF421 family)
MCDGSHARPPLFARVTGTAISCAVSISRGEAASSENASDDDAGGGAARQAIANTRAANATLAVNREIGGRGNLVIDDQITRFLYSPILSLAVSLGFPHIMPGMQTQMWHNMFALGLPLAEKVLRPVLVYLFLIVGLRLAGKRELAQLNPFDLVVLLTLSNTVQNAIIGEDNSVTGGLIGATTLLLVNYVLVRFVSRHERLERFVEGDSEVLIEDGKIKHDCLQKEAITVFELLGAAHKQGFAGLDEIDRAVLEPSGSICFFGKKPTPDITRHDEIMKRLDQITAQLAALKA